MDILVRMQVERVQLHVLDQVVEVWGYVGDYEVCVHLSVEEASTQGLLEEGEI